MIDSDSEYNDSDTERKPTADGNPYKSPDKLTSVTLSNGASKETKDHQNLKKLSTINSPINRSESWATADVVSMRDTEDGPQIRTGWVIKEGQIRKSWRNRYFVLEQGVLRYYTNEIKVPPYGTGIKGGVLLYGVVIREEGTRLILEPDNDSSMDVNAVYSKKADAAIQEGIVPRRFVCEIGTFLARNEWRRAFQEHIDYINN